MRFKQARTFLTQTSADMIEGALVMPLLALVTLALVNLSSPEICLHQNG